MEHADAVRTMAAEGYVLGDMTEAEIQAFEAHMAECHECLEAAEACEALIAALLDLMR